MIFLSTSLFFSTLFSLFFLHKTLYIYIFLKMRVFIGECGKWGASISVFGYTSASRPFNEVASIGLSWYTNASLLFLPCHQPFLCFSNFWFNLRVAFWRHFWALFPTNFIWTESSDCLVFNGLGLVRFEVTVVEISRSEGRWRKTKEF